MITTTCKKCGKRFVANQGERVCYDHYNSLELAVMGLVLLVALLLIWQGIR